MRFAGITSFRRCGGWRRKVTDCQRDAQSPQCGTFALRQQQQFEPFPGAGARRGDGHLPLPYLVRTNAAGVPGTYVAGALADHQTIGRRMRLVVAHAHRQREGLANDGLRGVPRQQRVLAQRVELYVGFSDGGSQLGMGSNGRKGGGGRRDNGDWIRAVDQGL